MQQMKFKLDPKKLEKATGSSGSGSSWSAMDKKPESPVYSTILDPNGRLGSDYKSKLPTQVQAGSITEYDKLTAGPALERKSIGFSSAMGDAQTRFANIQADQRGMNALRDRALATGPSAWANLQTQQQKLGEQTALDQSAKAQSGAMANAMSNMAMRGGVGGGASMRAARQSAQDQALAAQGVRRQGQMDRLGIATSDEQMRQQALSQLPAAELAWLQPQMDKAKMLTGLQMEEQGRRLDADKYNSMSKMEADKFNTLNAQDVQKYNIGNDLATKQFNISNKLDADKTNYAGALNNEQFNTSNLLKGVGDKNNYNLDKYKTDMAGWAANKTADGMTSGGKK